MFSKLLFLTATFSLFVAHAADAPIKPHAFEKEIAAFETSDKKTPPPQNAILFAGDSTFTKWKTIHEDLPAYTVINRGFGGSQMSDLLFYTDRVVLPYKPRLIVIQEGGNDLTGGKTPEQLITEMKAFIATVRAVQPEVPIVLCSIVPNSARWSQADLRRKTNAMIKALAAEEKNVTFLDLFDAFLGPDGKPNDSLFIEDKMHPSAAGYALRAKLTVPVLGAPDKK